MKLPVLVGGCCITGLFVACSGPRASSAEATRADGDPAAAQALIDEADLLRHIAVLSSDEFEGRGPGTPGEDLTVAYLTRQFEALGLAPGNPDGTYVQQVPLVGFKADPRLTLSFGGATKTLAFPDDYVAVSRRNVPEVTLARVPLVFVGYGVVAPEYGWDDYKDIDVRGKAIVMLVNDPPLADSADPSKLDDARFGGRAMTYYGRWTYKYEIASAKGAAAAILVHETGPAGYPYEVVSGSWSRENFDIERADGNRDRVAVEGWIREGVARELFSGCGLDFDAAKQQALSRDFRPLALGDGAVDIALRNTLRKVASRNVCALLPGGAKRDELVVYTAHWDHLGRDAAREGDQIFNGALDNATGCAGLLEMAQAFVALGRGALERSVLFLAVTAEEKGLLGSQYYAEHPLYPLSKTLAAINMDGLEPWGRTRDITSSGLGNSTLHELLVQVAATQQRTVKGDDEPEKGGYFRSDHFEFAKRGVPSLNAGAGKDFIDRPAGWGQWMSDDYTAHHYHKPSDEIRAEWDLSGAIEDVQALFAVGLELTRASTPWPTWSDGAEFKRVREASLRAR